MTSARSGRRVLLAALSIALAGGPLRAAAATVVAQGRPATLHVPPSYVPSIPTPLVILLHGYGSSSTAQEAYMQFTPLADEFGFLYLTPDGKVDCLGNQFWNATDACCNFCGSADDSGYLKALIEATATGFNVDRLRVFLIGHSNGGFMAYRMACDHPRLIAAIASLAGATYADPTKCGFQGPVHVLQLHGTADATILFGGGAINGVVYPGAIATVEDWATRNGCSPVADTSAAPRDLEANLPGSESTVTRYATGCFAGGSAELWTIVGGQHVPALSSTFSRQVVEFLMAHPKPAGALVPTLQPGMQRLLPVALLAVFLVAYRRLRRGRSSQPRASRPRST
ncbi:MAG: alpha/beta hydrolase family esterase [Myxococcota bacterium]